MDWSRRLSQEIVAKSGKRLNMLADARAFMLTIKDGRELRQHWQNGAALLMKAAEGGDVKAATDQIILALLLDGALDLKHTQPAA